MIKPGPQMVCFLTQSVCSWHCYNSPIVCYPRTFRRTGPIKNLNIAEFIIKIISTAIELKCLGRCMHWSAHIVDNGCVPWKKSACLYLCPCIRMSSFTSQAAVASLAWRHEKNLWRPLFIWIIIGAWNNAWQRTMRQLGGRLKRCPNVAL